jgi:transcriptional regulator with XRE-family HTH domain
MAVMRRFYEDVGRRLRRVRTEAGLTQQDLADAVGLSRASIANMEAGRQPFPAHMLFALARALDVTVENLLPDTSVLDDSDAVPEDAIEGLDEPEKNWVRKVLTPREPSLP